MRGTGQDRPTMYVKRLRDDAQLPRSMTSGAAGMDLSAAIDSPLSLAPGARALIPTGLAIALPPGHEGQVRPRSGLAVRHGVTVLNAPGTIDEDYRGEVKVALINLGDEVVAIEPGMRVAQLVVAPVTSVKVVTVDLLDETQRGGGGFGHTG
ncbi:MAG: dUTP diphosphatase [Proteobacteria bacterium]|nr:MAG: dUTP diphosphatase [Pseudomonadota bacterium]PIE18895.1 MAG: dUTP diphosphatase [Pseudomonadota bacterium]